MPLFEYRCSACGHAFEALVQGSQKPACPSCQSRKLEKLFSAFAVTSGGRETAPSMGPGACGSCGDPRGPGSCSISDDD